MPASIPTYDAPQVELAPLPGVRQSSVASPELFDTAAREQRAGAQALTQAGEGLAQVTQKLRERNDADQVFRAETSIKDSFLQQEQDWRAQRQGRFAKGITQDAQKWWADNIDKTAQGLDNDNQRRLFQQRAAAFREASLNSVAGFESQQLERSHDQAWAASKNVTINAAAAASTPDAIDNARAELQRSNAYQAARKGWEPEVLQAQNEKDLTALHASVLTSLAASNPVAAKAYFDKYQNEIDASRRPELQKFATQASATAIGQQAADAVWQQSGPKYDTDPANQDQMEAQLRDQFKSDPFAQKAAIDALRQRTMAFDKGRQEREASTESTVWKQINQGATLTQVQSMPEYLQLNGKTQTAMKDYMETKARQQEAQKDADLAKKNFAAYAVYSKPDNLNRMSEDEIINLTPDLGATLTNHLLEKKRSMEGKVIQANMDDQDFDHVAAEAGLRPFDPKKDEGERAQLGELKYRIESEIDAAQQKVNRPLTRDEKMGIMRREMDNQVMVHRTILPDVKKSLVLLSPDELKDAYVNVDGQRVKLADIPMNDRATIIRKRQERGLPVSEQLIAQTWLRAQQARKKTTSTAAQ